VAWVERHGRKFRGRYRDASGTILIAGTSTSKRAALRLAQEAEVRTRRGTRRDKAPGTISFSEYFLDHWLPNRVAELSTVAAYRAHFTVALNPTFGDTPIEKISQAMVQRWVAQQVASGSRPGNIRARYRTLATVLGSKRGVSAVRDGLIDTSPCAGIDLPFAPSREVEAYSVVEVDLLLRHIGAWWQPLIILAVDTGLRWGELMGLEVRDFTADFRQLTTRRTIVEVPQHLSPSRFATKDYPKGRQARRVTLTGEGSAAIEGLVASRQLDRGDRLFTVAAGDHPLRTDEWPNGLPVSRSRFRTAVWIPAHRAASIPTRRFHDLRATHITWLISGGADISTVMRRVGHARLSTTQVYLAALPDADEVAVQALESVRSRYRNP
jgi:integrase